MVAVLPQCVELYRCYDRSLVCYTYYALSQRQHDNLVHNLTVDLNKYTTGEIRDFAGSVNLTLVFVICSMTKMKQLSVAVVMCVVQDQSSATNETFVQ